MCQRILTRAHSTGKKRLKRSEPLLLKLCIVILSLFVLFFQCGHSWAFWRAARHDPTRVVSATKQTYIFVFSPTQRIVLTHAHILADSTCTAVRNNTNAACQFAATYKDDCGTMCAPNTPVQAQACHFQAPQARSRIPRVLGRFGAQMPPGSTY